MKLGYTDFINKHKTIFLIGFFLSVLVVFIPPVFFNEVIFDSNLAMQYSIYSYSVSPILLLANINKSYQSHKIFIDSLTYKEFINNIFIPHFVWNLIVSIIFWFTIITFLVLLIKYFKHKKFCKILLELPLALYIVYTIIICAIGASVPFIGFYLAIILEVLVILYCVGFQHFPKTPPREHKPTDKERIAELEQQVAELQKEREEISL